MFTCIFGLIDGVFCKTFIIWAPGILLVYPVFVLKPARDIYSGNFYLNSPFLVLDHSFRKEMLLLRGIKKTLTYWVKNLSPRKSGQLLNRTNLLYHSR